MNPTLLSLFSKIHIHFGLLQILPLLRKIVQLLFWNSQLLRWKELIKFEFFNRDNVNLIFYLFVCLFSFLFCHIMRTKHFFRHCHESLFQLLIDCIFLSINLNKWKTWNVLEVANKFSLKTKQSSFSKLRRGKRQHKKGTSDADTSV